MIASRRAARPTGPSTNEPSESGPRWTSVALIRASASGSAPRAEAIPQMPHTGSHPISRLLLLSTHIYMSLKNNREKPCPTEPLDRYPADIKDREQSGGI